MIVDEPFEPEQPTPIPEPVDPVVVALTPGYTQITPEEAEVIYASEPVVSQPVGSLNYGGDHGPFAV